jgi:hypothetical protein
MGRELTNEELRFIDDQVAAWKELERETLTKLKMPPPQTPTSGPSAEVVPVAAEAPASGGSEPEPEKNL